MMYHIWEFQYICVAIYIYTGNFIIPTDEHIFLRGVAQPPTSYAMFVW